MSINGSAESYTELRGSLSLPEAIQGKSAYELALLNGFKGTEKEWLDSFSKVDQYFSPSSSKPQSGTSVAEAISAKQDKLIDGLTIKTINGKSILGYGDLSINSESEIEIPTFTLNVDEFESGYLIDGKISAHASFITSPFLPVTELSTILLENVHSPALTIATFYDEQQNYLSIIKVNLNQYFASRTIQVPLGAKFMRCCTQPATFTKTPMKVSYIYYAPENKTQKLLAVVNGLCEKTDYALVDLFKKSAQPMITFIDDDTVSLEHIARYKSYCDAVGIKGCFSVLTSQLDEVDGLAEKLLEYEQDGFQAIIHCNTQGDEFKEVNASGQRTADNIALCEKNLVTGLQKMHKYGFTNYKYWCTPFGYSDPALQNMAKKWGINCLISSGNMDYNKPNASYKRWHISRFTLLGPSDDTGNTTLTRIKNAINQACLDGGWVLITTHMYENGWADSATGVARLQEIINYAKTRGVVTTPIGEAFSIREPIYRFYETF